MTSQMFTLDISVKTVTVKVQLRSLASPAEIPYLVVDF